MKLKNKYSNGKVEGTAKEPEKKGTNTKSAPTSTITKKNINFKNKKTILIILILLLLIVAAALSTYIFINSKQKKNEKNEQEQFNSAMYEDMMQMDKTQLRNIADNKQTDVVSLYKSAQAKYILNDFKGAAEDYDKIIKSGKYDYNTYMNKGEASMLAGNYEQTIKSYEQSLQLINSDKNLNDELKKELTEKVNGKIVAAKYRATLKQ